MSLFTDLKEVLTPYAQRIKSLAAADEEIKADLDDILEKGILSQFIVDSEGYICQKEEVV